LPKRGQHLIQESAALRAKGWTYRQIAAHWQDRRGFNARVAFRLAHGLTQQSVADLWNEIWPDDGDSPKTAKHVAYWEAWPGPSGRTPSPDTLNRLAFIYQCRAGDLLGGEDHSGRDANTQPARAARFATEVPDASDAADIAAGAGLRDELAPVLRGSNIKAGLASPIQRDAQYQQLAQALINWARDVERRELLHIFGWVTAMAAVAPVLHGLNPEEQQRVALAIQSPGRVDAKVVEHLEAVLARCRRRADVLGPTDALDTALAQRNLIRALLPGVDDEALRLRLSSLSGNFSRFAGWLCFDLDDFASAAYYYEDARVAAHEASDTALAALVLCNMSRLATWHGKPGVGLDHAVAAQHRADQTTDANLRAYAADLAAYAYAMDGQSHACVERLDVAQNLLAASGGDASLVYFQDLALHQSSRAECFLQLGDAEQAISCANDSLASMDSSFVRNAALTTLDLGIGYLRLGDVDVAADGVGDAAALAARNRSARLAGRVREARRRLDPWRDRASVTHLTERLACYGLT